MTDRKTLKLPTDEYDKHNQRRRKMGLSWPEYVNGEASEYEAGGLSETQVRKVVREELQLFREELLEMLQG